MRVKLYFAIVAALLFSAISGLAQTFNGSATNTAGNNLIPSAGTGGCAGAP